MPNDFENYKEQSLTRPRDEAWDNWHSWKDAKVGDKVQGYIADAFYRPEEKNPDGSVAFRPQRGITLKPVDKGPFVNVGVKDIDFILAATDNLRIGDPLTIELTKIAAPQSKGKQGAKIFSYYGTNLPANTDKKTVKELTDENRLEGGTVSKEPEATADDIPFESSKE